MGLLDTMKKVAENTNAAGAPDGLVLREGDEDVAPDDPRG